MPEEIGITLDGRAVKAIKGEMIIAAAERAGTYIPRFCYHPRMKPVGMCRMCLVEVKGPRGFSLSPACFVPVAEGMEVVTNSAPVKKAQDGVLEFLLVNHPLDCPVCDKGGECPLQDQTMAYGPGETRFVEEKRHWDKPMPLSPLVLIDRERCIQCARCTRFAEEVAGDAGIDFASRSDSTEVAIYPGQPFGSNFSGNIVQICPVGALLAKPYRFKARPWDLEQVESTCSYCAVGCRVAVQSSSDQLVRFIGVDSDPVNWGWLCDKGRFGFEAVNSPDRLARPLVRRSGPGLVEAAWADAFAEIIARLSGVPGERIGVLGGSRLANEDAYAWAKFARTVLRTDNVDAQVGDGLPGDLVASLPRATIDQVCDASLIVTLAPDIKEELPVLYLRLRHAAVEKGVPIIEISPGPTGLSSRATECLHYRPGELSSLVEALCGGTPVKDDIAGIPAQQVERARSAIASVTRDAAAPDGTGADGTGADGTGADGTGADGTGPGSPSCSGGRRWPSRPPPRLPRRGCWPGSPASRSCPRCAVPTCTAPWTSGCHLACCRDASGWRTAANGTSTTGGHPCPRRPGLTPWACSPGRRPGSSTSSSSSGPILCRTARTVSWQRRPWTAPALSSPSTPSARRASPGRTSCSRRPCTPNDVAPSPTWKAASAGSGKK